MRRVFVVSGICIIVLLVIAGCSSPQQGTGTVYKNPAPAKTNSEQEALAWMQTIFDCKNPPADPRVFTEYLHDVPGYVKRVNYVPYNKSTMIFLHQWENLLMAGYFRAPEPDYTRSIAVGVKDYGPCAKGDYVLASDHVTGLVANGTESRVTFHGYPAVLVKSSSPEGHVRENMIIGVSDRLIVNVIVQGFYPDSFTGADADIETFANAIDFRGIASSV